MNVNKVILILVLVMSVISCKSQNIDTIIQEQVLGEKELILNKKQTIFLQKNFNLFFDKLINNQSEYSSRQIKKTVDILYFITVNDFININNRVKTIEFFTNLLTSESLDVRASVLNPLIRYRYVDFNEKSKMNIEKLFTITNEKYLRSEIYKLAGFLKLKKAEIFLVKKFLNKKENNPKNKWDVMLSLSRLGNKDALNYCIRIIDGNINKTNKKSFKSEFYAYYIRQPESLELLIKILNNKSMEQDISKPSIMTPVNYEAYNYLKKFIIGYPSELFERSDLSYEKHIEKIINWFDKNKNNIHINKDVY